MMRAFGLFGGVLFMGIGIWVWYAYAQSNCAFQLGQCGILSTGLATALSQAGYYALACLLGTLGWGLFVWGRGKFGGQRVDSEK